MEKKSKKEIYGKANYSKEMVSFFKILVIVIVILGLVYFLMQLANGEIKLGNKKEEKVDVQIQYEEILAGQILNRGHDEYYVMLFKFSEDNASSLLSLKDGYKYVTDSLPVYIVDLEKGFNTSLQLDEGELIEKPSNISEVKVKDNTLFKVKEGKVIERITSDEKIVEYFGNLSK